MPTLLQINTTLNYGSTGRIAENIGLVAKKNGWRSVMAHGPRMKNPSDLDTIQINTSFDEKIHGLLYTLLLDRHGLGSSKATRNFIDLVKSDIKPDLIHLHNLHGYYINYEILFKFLKSIEIPIVWTLHDCWSFTGHCPNFDAIGCDRWKSGCFKCPQYRKYPYSLFFDNSIKNYQDKKFYFNSISDRLTLVPVSYWLESLVKQSFLSGIPTQVIHNGINLNVFKPYSKLINRSKKIVLAVANPWCKEKGLDDIMQLRSHLQKDDYEIMMVGLTDKQIKQLPLGIKGLESTQNARQLAELYSSATVFINPTYQDNYPTTNLEAIAVGTPVVTYDTGGSPEAINNRTGMVVERGNIEALADAIRVISDWDSNETTENCRLYAVENFDMNRCFQSYMDLYKSLI